LIIKILFFYPNPLKLKSEALMEEVENKKWTVDYPIIRCKVLSAIPVFRAISAIDLYRSASMPSTYNSAIYFSSSSPATFKTSIAKEF